MSLTLPQNIRLRQILHEVVFSDELKLGYMVGLFDSELFNVDCNMQTKEINLKVKKTNIRKRFGSQYTHDVFFYNGLISEVYSYLINRYMREITDAIKHDNNFDDNIDYLSYINAGTICNINVLLDNVVNIKL